MACAVPRNKRDLTKILISLDIRAKHGVKTVMQGDNIRTVVNLIRPIEMDDGLRIVKAAVL